MRIESPSSNSAWGRIVAPLLAAAILLPLGCQGGVVGGQGDGGPARGDSGDSDGDSGGGGGGGGGLPFEECAAVTEQANNSYQPVDIVFTIDNTPSMLDELAEVRANMNAFSKSIVDSGLDVHIVLISCLPGECGNDKWHGICIDAPLGAAGGCAQAPYQDSNPPAYLHVSRPIPSLKGLARTVETYDQWKSMIRADSAKHFVVVSDDNDEWSAAQFDSALLARDPALAGYKFHGIFSQLSKEAACAVGGSEPCCTYAAPGGEGVVYKELVSQTQGVQGDLCLQDFDGVFAAVATSVIRGARLSCSWQLPSPPEGKTLDPNLVNVEFVDGAGGSVTFGRVDSAADCAKVEQAWHYDDPASPRAVEVCPQTCALIQGKQGAQMNVVFGCATELAPLT